MRPIGLAVSSSRKKKTNSMSVLRIVGLLVVVSLSISRAELIVSDAKTRVSRLQTLFTDTELLLSIEDKDQSSTLKEQKPYQLFIDDNLYSSGAIAANQSIPFVLERSGRRNIRLEVQEQDNNDDNNGTPETVQRQLTMQSYPSGVVIIPFLILCISLLLDSKLVMAFYAGTAVASTFVAGHVLTGSANVFTVYLVQALETHVHTMLFLLFFSGIIGVLQRSGGLDGVTNAMLRICTTRRTLQLGIFCLGSLMCWDDVSTVLITGETTRCSAAKRNLSRQKLAFLVNASSLSNLIPVSTLTGVVLGTVRGELDRLGNTELSAVSILLHSLKYAHYPIFMAVLVLLLAITQREFGPMLIAERNAIVRGVQTAADEIEVSEQPEGQPALWWIAVFPLLVLIAATYGSFLGSGESDDEIDRGFYEKLEHASMAPALLDGVSSTITVLILIGVLTFVLADERITFGLWHIAKKILKRSSDESSPRSIINLDSFIRTLLSTAGRAFPPLINLVFSWATAIAFSDAGVGNLVARCIVGSTEQYIGVISFCLATLFSLVTGSDVWAVSTLIPLGLEIALNRSEAAAYATVGAIVGGAMAGRQLSPISQVTILSASTSACTTWGHLSTQAPYILVAFGLTVMLGILPDWPNVVSFLMGLIGITGFVYLVCKPILCENGRFDAFTMLFAHHRGSLRMLAAETAASSQEEKESLEEAAREPETLPPDGITADSCSVDEDLAMNGEDTC